MTAHAIHIRLLGAFALQVGDTLVDLPPGSRRLVSLVALAPDSVSRVHAASTLWPQLSEKRAAGNLRSALWRLRGPGMGAVIRVGEKLSLAAGVTVDAHAMERDARALLEDRVDGRELPPAALFAVELLPDCYDDWVSFERERLRQLGLHALEVLARRLSTQGQFGLAIEVAHRALRGEPLRESATRVLMEVHIAEGNHSEAVRQYLRFRSQLLTELGLEPSPTLRALAAELTPGHPVSTTNGALHAAALPHSDLAPAASGAALTR